MSLYNVTQLLKNLVQIESIASYGDNLLLGTRQGHLRMYNIVKSVDDKPNVELMRYNKTFSKKPVQQLEVLPAHSALVCLTDNIIQVHDINSFNFPMLSQLVRTKGATLFTVDATEEAEGTIYRLCVVVKRKLQFYKWKEGQFEKLAEDVNLIEVPKAIAWCQNTICVGYKGEYCCVDLKGVSKDLFPTSSNRSTEPYIVKASDTTFGLVRENTTVLVNHEAAAEKSKVLKWSDIPSALVWDEPYCVALLGDTAEIQTIESDNVLQTIPDLQKIRFISRSKQGVLYAASISQVWVMQVVDFNQQRKLLLESKQFQSALKLSAVSDETEAEKKEIHHQIQTLLAYDLFYKKQFRSSMSQFLKLGTNPSDVIRLFPNLLPQQTGQELEVSNELTGRELEDGLQALIEYLTDLRYEHQVFAQLERKAPGNSNEHVVNKNKTTQNLLQIIDTTLLKCYLQTNDALVAPLLRSNHCHLAETERTLMKYGKDNELIILYYTKGQHRRALELLQSKENVERIIGYLQHLGAKDMGLIFEFADWVFKVAPDEGLKIFTEDLVEVEGLHRPKVLDYLLRSHTSRVIPYLEHVVHNWEEGNQLFHNALIHKYLEIAMSGEPGASVTRKKLRQFLETSKNYKPDTILLHFPTDSLLEERTVILGKLERHEQSIAIFVRVLGDIDAAIEYCHKVYERGNQNVYVLLIKILLDPDSMPIALKGVTLCPKTAQPDRETALKILEDNAARINPLVVLPILPDSIPVSKICKFLQIALHESIKERRRVQLLKGLLYAEHLQCQELRLHLESQSVLVNDLNICPVCKKRFGNQSALVRYPNGDVVHYSCQDKNL